jgi:hypothetical protein
MPDNTEQMIKPKMHHVNLKTNRLNEMIGWYASVIGTRVFPISWWSVHFK